MKRAIVEYDYIRAVAVLLVVLGHCTYYKIVTLNGGIDYGINSEQSMVGKILSLITLTLYAFHMPLFIALSGSLWAVIIQDKGTPTFLRIKLIVFCYLFCLLLSFGQCH